MCLIMSERTKRIGIIFIILISVFGLGISFGYVLKPATETTTLGDSEIVTNLTIDYGNGDVQSFPNEMLLEGNSVLDQLKLIERRHGIIIESRAFFGIGIFIEGIHGVRNTNVSYWQYWVNGEYAKIGATQYILKDGDDVLWKRTSDLE